MWRDFVMRNKVGVAFVLGAIYIGSYLTLLALMDAQDEENDRIEALRWQNTRLIERMAAAVDKPRGGAAGGAE